MSKLFMKWQLPDRARPFKAKIIETENRFKLPHNLLGRVLWQESRFRPDIISGETVSSAGAVGIAQIVPKWHLDVNPLDPDASIEYAGRYLKQLHDRFGSWSKALAAYNWGQGNLSKYLSGDIDYFPTETKNYVSEIMSDIF